jgi:Na+/serine symporter
VYVGLLLLLFLPPAAALIGGWLIGLLVWALLGGARMARQSPTLAPA